MVFNNFINYIKFDEYKRIIVSVNVNFEKYLHVDKNQQLIKKAIIEILKNDFIKLEIGKNRARITVKEGTEDKNIELIKKELSKGLELAMRFMGM